MTAIAPLYPDGVVAMKTLSSPTQPEPVVEVGSDGYSGATTVPPGVAVTTEGYKRKMDDQEGSRAAKNPRSSSPTFATLEVWVLILVYFSVVTRPE